MAPQCRKAPKSSRATKHAHLKKKLQDRNTRHSTPDTTTYRGLLGLPAELRNEVYELCAIREPVYLRPRGATPLITLVCHQIRDEFTSLLTKLAPSTAPTVTAQAHDFNFRAAKNFMRRVQADPHADIKDFTHPGGRKLSVDLSISASFCGEPTLEQLGAWFRWLRTLEVAPAVEYGSREVAEPEKALALFVAWCDKHRIGRSAVVAELMWSFQVFVKGSKAERRSW